MKRWADDIFLCHVACYEVDWSSTTQRIDPFSFYQKHVEKCWSNVESLESLNCLIEASSLDCIQQFNTINKRVWENRGLQCRTFPLPYVPGILWESIGRPDRRCRNERSLRGEASSCHSRYDATGLRPSWYRDIEESVSYPSCKRSVS